jgi:hypothetical protein
MTADELIQELLAKVEALERYAVTVYQEHSLMASPRLVQRCKALVAENSGDKQKETETELAQENRQLKQELQEANARIGILGVVKHTRKTRSKER